MFCLHGNIKYYVFLCSCPVVLMAKHAKHTKTGKIKQGLVSHAKQLPKVILHHIALTLRSHWYQICDVLYFVVVHPFCRCLCAYCDQQNMHIHKIRENKITTFFFTKDLHKFVQNVIVLTLMPSSIPVSHSIFCQVGVSVTGRFVLISLHLRTLILTATVIQHKYKTIGNKKVMEVQESYLCDKRNKQTTK